MATSPGPQDPEDVARFDRWSSSYERSWLQRAYFDRVHAAVLDEIATGGAPESLLDVGCGTGRLLRTAGARWTAARLIGVDPAQGMVDVARRLTPGAAFHLGAAEALPLPDASVDAATSTTSFHHWRDPAVGLREVARVLRPGGRFVLADFALPARLIRLLPRHGGGHAHSAAEIRALFEAAGLRGVRQRGIVAPFVLLTSGVRP
jgi:ubiquinone/menaquinone biosynthesis C-methylase UbiE